MIDVTEKTDATALTPVKSRVADFLELTKPRLNALVLLTTFAGYFLASGPQLELTRLFHALLGTFIVAGSAAAFNQVLERSNDARMARTRTRPIPAGRVEAYEGVVFGAVLGVMGLAQLALAVNPLTALLGLASWLIYVLVYTPMKTRSAWNTVVGAISGALPPLMGWTAARNSIDPGAWTLFGILFFWQLPHFFALAWRFRSDYLEGGFQMLSARDESGRRSGWAMTIGSLALVPVGAGLTYFGVTGTLYLIGSVLLGVYITWQCLRFTLRPTERHARSAFLTSLVYLTSLMVLIFLNRLS